jgi:cytochrome c-type biogenesis protein CcmH
MLSRLLVVLAFTLLLLPTIAAADALDDGVRRVALQLQCPVCEGQSVADSNSGLAKDMRTLIRARIAAGVPDQQILDEFVASYGDSILSEPPKRGIALGVWLGPAVGLLFGALIVAVLLLSWRHPRRATPSPLATLDPDVADEFHRFRNEFGR